MALPQLSPGVYWDKDRSVSTDDGATIRFTVLGGDQPNAHRRPAVVLLSGFLCADTWWHHLAPTLVEHGYRVVLLHYRGIAVSGLPTRPRPDSISIPRFAGDVLDVLHAADIGDVALVGHSMGGQVMVEVAQRMPERVTAMVAVTATDRSPVTNLYRKGWLLSPAVAPLLLTARQLREPLGTSLWRGAWRSLPFLRLTQLVNAFGAYTPPSIIRSYVDHAASLSGTYAVDVLEAMHAHRGDPEALASLDIPTLVIAADADPFTPVSTAKAMVGRLPDARLCVVGDTTHAAILEAPTEVNRLVLDHLAATAGR